MNPSPNNVFVDSKCLSLEQLKLYHEDKLSPREKHTVENHLLDCELCSQALSGFAVAAVTVTDVADVNKRIDLLTGAKAAPVFTPKAWFSKAAGVLVRFFSLFFFSR